MKSFLAEEDMYAYGELLGGNQEWRDEFTQYLDILTDYSNKVSNIDKQVSYIESHDTFLNDDQNSTKNITTKQIIDLYSLLTYKFENTIYYVRPKKAPYLPDDNKVIENFNVKEVNELDFFEDDFLHLEKIKQANQTHKNV